MANTNSWQCKKCGLIVSGDSEPIFCDHCGHSSFHHIAFKDYYRSNSTDMSSFSGFITFMFYYFYFIIKLAHFIWRIVKKIATYFWKKVRIYLNEKNGISEETEVIEKWKAHFKPYDDISMTLWSNIYRNGSITK